MATFVPVLLLVTLAACGSGASDEDAVLAKRRARTKQICACDSWRCVAQATIDYDRWVALREDRLRTHTPSPAITDELRRLDREAHACEARFTPP